MVGIVVVSHSDALARGVVALAREMSPPELPLEPAGGIGEQDVLGTSAELVRGAIERAMSPDGVLVLMDLGSALMSAELAVELLQGASGPVRLSDAPLVEGTVAAAVAAGGGASLEEVAAEAGRAPAMKAAQIAPVEPTATPVADPAAADSEVAPDVEVELPVSNEVGLHARPAARFVETARRFDAEVLVAKAGSGAAPVSARSLTNIVALSARRGDTVRVLASGAQAHEAVAALQELAAGGFGDGVPPAAPMPARRPEPGTVLNGVGVGTGIAAGAARLIGGAPPTPGHEAGTPAQELIRLERGLDAARAAITTDRERLRASAGAAEAAIFDAHLALLDDEALLQPARDAIAAGIGAERAIQSAAEQVADIYRGLESPLLAERAADVLDVGHRIASAIAAEAGDLAAHTRDPAAHTRDPAAHTRDPAAHTRDPAAHTRDPAAHTSSPSSFDAIDIDSHSQILVADELVPSQTAPLDPRRVAGIATARGSATAHAAIIARALGIPAVLGLGEAILGVADGTMLLLDGGAGTVTVAPPAQAVADATAQAARARVQSGAARARAAEPAVLAGGERLEVFANVGSVEDAQRAVELGAEGVGLLRTEFLFLDRTELPSEEEQAQTLREIALALDGRPLIVRTLDAGADKPLPALALPAETNPFLGVRGIRVGLRDPALLSVQLRAVLRVAAEHPLKLMLPMVATLAEVAAVRMLLEQARADTAVTAPLELGIMVEVPAAALMADQLAPHVDFFSLGTNDLTQYTMAAERGDARLESLLAEPQPAVLRLVRETVRAARTHGRWVGVCGEMAGDPAGAVLLAGLGVTELSMAPRQIPEVKDALRGVELGRASAAATAALAADSAAAAREQALALL